MPELLKIRKKFELLASESELAQATADDAKLLTTPRRTDKIFDGLDEEEMRQVAAMRGNRENLMRDFFMQLSFSESADVRGWAEN